MPGARTKNGHRHVVPLSEPAIEIIKEALADAGEAAKFVFPSQDEGPLSPLVTAKTIMRARQPDDERPFGRFGLEHWTAHDLRRTAVSGMARLGVPPIVLGHVINHRSVTKAGVTLSVYAQYDYAKEKRAALELWAKQLNEMTHGETV
jgi:integrase